MHTKGGRLFSRTYQSAESRFTEKIVSISLRLVINELHRTTLSRLAPVSGSIYFSSSDIPATELVDFVFKCQFFINFRRFYRSKLQNISSRTVVILAFCRPPYMRVISIIVTDHRCTSIRTRQIWGCSDLFSNQPARQFHCVLELPYSPTQTKFGGTGGPGALCNCILLRGDNFFHIGDH
jgi:hypothetical protein